MIKVNNKKTIHFLAMSSLKEYKMRNIFTLITIILSVSLIAGYVFLASAFEESNKRALAKRQHVIYHNVSSQQVEQINQNPQILGSREFKTGKSFELDDYILRPSYMEENDTDFLQIDIRKGRYPEKADEVLVFEEMLIKMGAEPKLGELISITFPDGSTEEFVVAGITKDDGGTDIYSLYFSREYAVNGSQLKDIPLDLASQVMWAERMSKETLLSVIREIGRENGIERKNINVNNAFADSLSYDGKEITIIILISAAVLLVSVLVIYSIFYISITERTRQFGQLKTLGMTQKQIKRMVKKEGAVLSLTGSLSGIGLGAAVSYILRPQGFRLASFLTASAFIMLADYITVQISIARPARLAAAIPPIEAVRLSGYEAKEGKVKTKKLERKLTPLNLSMIASGGARRKSAVTLLSLSLAGIVFMCAATAVTSINQEKYTRQGWTKFGEYIIGLSLDASYNSEVGSAGVKTENPLSSQLIENLQKIEGVKEVTALQNLSVAFSCQEGDGDDIAAPFGADDAGLVSQYLKEGTVDYERMVENRELIIAHNELTEEIYGFEFQLGDTVTLKWYNGKEYEEAPFTISGILKSEDEMYENKDMYRISDNTGWFLMPDDLLKQMVMPGFNLNYRLIVSCEDYYKDAGYIDSEISDLIDENPLLGSTSLKDMMEHHKKQFVKLYATFMGAAVFVIAFSLINLLNTLISNIMSRKRQFACLGAVGAGSGQIKTMILGEGLYFAVVNLFVTGILGTLSGYAMVKIMAWNGARYMEYRLPFEYLAGYSIFNLLVPILLAFVIAGIINKKSLVERLRETE